MVSHDVVISSLSLVHIHLFSSDRERHLKYFKLPCVCVDVYFQPEFFPFFGKLSLFFPMYWVSELTHLVILITAFPCQFHNIAFWVLFRCAWESLWEGKALKPHYNHSYGECGQDQQNPSRHHERVVGEVQCPCRQESEWLSACVLMCNRQECRLHMLNETSKFPCTLLYIFNLKTSSFLSAFHFYS